MTRLSIKLESFQRKYEYNSLVIIRLWILGAGGAAMEDLRKSAFFNE